MREKASRKKMAKRKGVSPSSRQARKEEYYQYERRTGKGRKRSSSGPGKFFILLLLIAAILAFLALFLKTRQPRDVSLVENTESGNEDLTLSEEEPEKPEDQLLMPADFPHYIAGNLSKGELEFVLSYVPDQILKEGPTDQTVKDTLSRMISGDIMNETSLFRSEKANAYSLPELQRFFDSFSSWSLKDHSGPYRIQGDILSMKADQLGILASANITEARIHQDKLEITYELDYMGGDSNQKKPFHAEKKAILTRTDGGLFQIEEVIEEKKKEIHPVEDQQNGSFSSNTKNTSPDNDQESQVKMTPPGHVSNKGKNAKTQQQKAYQMGQKGQKKDQKSEEKDARTGQDIFSSREKAVEGVLLTIKSHQQKGQIPVDEPAQRTGAYHYAMADLDGDGIEELLVESDAQDGNQLKRFVQIYQINQKGEGTYQPLLLQGYFSAIRLFLPQDGKGGIYLLDSSSRASERGLYRTTLSQGKVITPSQPEEILMEDSPEMAEFMNSVQEIRWKKVK